jgi:dihydrofolate reductase
MRKVFLFMMTTLDGYFEGPNHDITWHNAGGEEFSNFANNQLDEVDTLVFGRRTYELMADFWPSEEAIEIEPGTAARMTSLKKVVFSYTPMKTDWQNVESSTDVVTKMKELKNAPGKDIAVLASSNLCLTLLKEGLLDEIRVMINPLVIGKGTPLFDGTDKLRQFILKDTRTFKSGNVLLTYTC